MFRSAVSSLALVGYLASQLAMFPHAHAAATPDLDSKPHVHMRGHSHSHSHPHSHNHGAPASDAKLPPVGEQGSQDHDQDALYLPNFGPARLQSSDNPLSQVLFGLLSIDGPTVAPTTAEMTAAGFLPAPDFLPDESLLFLDLRTLRI
jgi:hypothetical protein